MFGATLVISDIITNLLMVARSESLDAKMGDEVRLAGVCDLLITILNISDNFVTMLID